MSWVQEKVSLLSTSFKQTSSFSMQSSILKVNWKPILDYRAFRVPELIPVLGSQPAGDVT